MHTRPALFAFVLAAFSWVLAPTSARAQSPQTECVEKCEGEWIKKCAAGQLQAAVPCPNNFACKTHPLYSQCATTCTKDNDCASDYYCDTLSASCVKLIENGKPCDLDNSCDSGHCEYIYPTKARTKYAPGSQRYEELNQKICCDTECQGDCRSCGGLVAHWLPGLPPINLSNEVGVCMHTSAKVQLCEKGGVEQCADSGNTGWCDVDSGTCETWEPGDACNGPSGISCSVDLGDPGSGAPAQGAVISSDSCGYDGAGTLSCLPTQNGKKFCYSAACPTGPGDGECPTCQSSADCVPMAYCAQPDSSATQRYCQPRSAAGGSCLLSDECAAGLFCVNNVCCTSSCSGVCERCLGTAEATEPGQKPGSCVPVPKNQRPFGGKLCPSSAHPEQPCSVMFCDGVRSDVCVSTTEACAEPTCLDNTSYAPGSCNNGECVQVPTSCGSISCDPLANTCRAECQGHEDCLNGTECMNGVCTQPEVPCSKQAPCQGPGQVCDNGKCVDAPATGDPQQANCGCRTPASSSESWAGLILTGAMLLVGRRRRGSRGRRRNPRQTAA